jgi:hypothetical protein
MTRVGTEPRSLTKGGDGQAKEWVEVRYEEVLDETRQKQGPNTAKMKDEEEETMVVVR